MAQLILSKGDGCRRGILRSIFPYFEVGPYFLVASLIIFVILVTVITLMFSTRQVTKGYVLNKLESQHQELVKESERYEMELSTVRSLNYIQQSSKVRSMVHPLQIVYIGGDSAIASR